MNAAAVLLAAALLIGPGPARVRARAGMASRGHRSPQGRGRARGPDPLAIASCLDVLAVCLEAGMAVSAAAAAAAPSAPATLGRVLRRAADLLALGADPAVVWSIPPTGPGHAPALAPEVIDAHGMASRPVPAPVWAPARSTAPQPAARPPHSRRHPIGDAIRPQQATTRQHRADHQQPTAGVPTQQKAKGPSPDQLPQQHAQHRQACQYHGGRAGPGQA